MIQLYIRNNENTHVFKAEKELKSFKKIHLDVNEEKTVTLSFNKQDLSYYHPKLNHWILENGTYEIEICTSYDDIKYREPIIITGQKEVESPYEIDVINAYNHIPLNVDMNTFTKLYGHHIPVEPPIKPITLASPMFHYNKSFFGKIIYKAMVGQAIKQLKEAKKMPSGIERDNKMKGALFLQRLLSSSSLRMIAMSAGGHLPFNVAEGMVHIANGRFIKGLRKMKQSYQAPLLPDEIKE